MNIVRYENPAAAAEMSWRRIALGIAAVFVLALAVGVIVSPAAGLSLIAAGTAASLFGVNSVAYETPVTGATAPTAHQSRHRQQVVAVVTGDGAATTFTITHNWGLSTAELAASFPEVDYEAILAAGNTAAPVISSKSANAVDFTCTAFSGAGLRVRLRRPHTMDR